MHKNGRSTQNMRGRFLSNCVLCETFAASKSSLSNLPYAFIDQVMYKSTPLAMNMSTQLTSRHHTALHHRNHTDTEVHSTSPTAVETLASCLLPY